MKNAHIFFVIAAIVIIISVIFEAWLFITYGNKPASEIPVWALWLMLGRR